MPVTYKPDQYHSVTPYLIASDAVKLIEFLKAAFGATEVEKILHDSGRVMHAEMLVGDSIIMMSQATEQYPAMPVMLYVYVKDCDDTYKKAVAAGATTLHEPALQFYGDRNATVKDQSGNVWCIGTHVEDVSPEELMRRMKAGK